MRKRLAPNTHLQIQGPDMLLLWKGGPYLKSLSLKQQGKPKQPQKTIYSTPFHTTDEYNESDDFEYILGSIKIDCEQTEQ